MSEKPFIRQRVLPASTSLFKSGSRARWLLFALWALLLGSIGLGAFGVFRTDEQNRLTAFERQMVATVQARVASLTVWYGTLMRDVEAFAATDPVRLFSAEGALQPVKGQEPRERESQRRFIKTQLEDFRTRHALLTVALFGEAESPLAQSGDAVAAEPLRRLAEVRAAGRPMSLPLSRGGNGRWVLEMLIPVFKPRYVDAAGTAVAGVLLVSVDVSHLMGDLAGAGRPGTGEGSLVLAQKVNGHWLLVTSATRDAQLSEAWQPTDRDEKTEGGEKGLALRFGLRPFPTRSGAMQAVYACGTLIPGTGWLVAKVLAESVVAEEREANLRKVLIVASLLAVLVSLLLFAIWWRMFERRDRAMSAELKRLYGMTRRQKQLLDGINASIQDGIALVAPSGRFMYVNGAFAALTGEYAETLLRKGCESLLSADLGQCMVVRLAEAHKQKDTRLTVERMRVRGEERAYQLLCAPFVGGEDGDEGVVFVFRDLTAFLAIQERSRRLIDRTVQAFMRAVEAVDGYLHGHAAHTRDLAVVLAKRLGRDDLEETLSTAARLSQVGMIRLPADLLSQQRALTPEERAELEKHVAYALDALDGIDFGMPVQQAIAHMYERMDGSGYPEGLSGCELCLEGRILGVASTFCAIMRPRSYRKALRLDEGLALFETECTRYDQAVVNALREFLRSPDGEAFAQGLTTDDTAGAKAETKGSATP